MSAKKSKSIDYQTLSSSAKNGSSDAHEQNSIKSLTPPQKNQTDSQPQTLNNSHIKQPKQPIPSADFLEKREISVTESVVFKEKVADNAKNGDINSDTGLSYSKQQKRIKTEKRTAKDYKLLSGDNWLARNGHTFTYVGLYLFSILVLFRPYELVPGLGFLSATAFYFAIATLLIYIPTQFITEGNLTILTTEVKAILAMTLIAIVTIPIAKDPGLAWKEFNDPYIKAVLIFIIMVNVLRTRRRLMGMVWLSLSIGVILSYMALGKYMRGEMNVEDYRVGVEIGGMFRNPNELSLHLVMMIPLAISLAIASKSKIMKVVYLVMSGIMLFANMVTYSRGGFLGLIAASAFLVWKFGRKHRVTVTLTSFFIGIIITLLAPGNFGLRVLSIFIPGLDESGSSNQRRELLERSIIVTLRNPWGIGIGNFPIVGIQNLVSHNAYTQVSAELGLFGLAAYLFFIISPFRKLVAIDSIQFAKNELNWFYYFAIGLQGSFIAFYITSFFASVAYYWFIYYLVAYAVAFRRIYQLENNLGSELNPKLI